jgi:hypothetical protein
MFLRDRSQHSCQRQPVTLHGVVFDISGHAELGPPSALAHGRTASEIGSGYFDVYSKCPKYVSWSLTLSGPTLRSIETHENESG